MPGATIAITYPKEAKFNMDYYLTHHMPMVQATWAPYGMKSWKVIQYNEDGAYFAQAFLEFDSTESWAKASASVDSKGLFDDVPNFSDKSPTLSVGTTVKEQSC